MQVAGALGERGLLGEHARAQVGRRVALEAGIAGVRVVRVGVADRRLVRDDEDVDAASELLRDRRGKGIADEDVLVLFLHHQIARRSDLFHHVGARGQADQRLVDSRHRAANRRRRAVGRAERVRRLVGRAREVVAAVVRGGLHLVPVVPAVVAAVLVIAEREVGERIVGVRVPGEGGGSRQLPWALHVGLPAGGIGGSRSRGAVREAKADPGRLIVLGAHEVLVAVLAEDGVGEVVEARGRGGVDQRQRPGAVRERLLLVEVDGQARDQRFPDVLDVEALVVERTGGGQDHRSGDAAVLAGRVGSTAPLDAASLADEALQAVGQRAGNLGASAELTVRVLGGPEVGAHAAGVGLAAAIDDDADGSLLEAGGVSLGDVPVEEREELADGGVAGVVADRPVRRSAVAEAHRDLDVGDARRARAIGVASVVLVDELVELREPAQHRDVAQADGVGCASVGRGDEGRDDDGLVLDDLIEPLVEDGHVVAAGGQAADREGAVGAARGGGDRRPKSGLRVHHHPAVGGAEDVVRVRIPELHVGGMRHVIAGDLARDRLVAVQAQPHAIGRRVIGIDEADGDVRSRRAELLEVLRLADADEGVLRGGAFQRLGLPPHLARAFTRGARVGEHVIAGGDHVLDQRVAGQRVLGVERYDLRGDRAGARGDAVPIDGARPGGVVGAGTRMGRRDLVRRGIRAGVDGAGRVAGGHAGLVRAAGPHRRRRARLRGVDRAEAAGAAGSVGGEVLRVGATGPAEQIVVERLVEDVVGVLAGDVAGATRRV